MVSDYPDRSERMLELRDCGNKIIELIGGRTVHPVSPRVGGFTKLPSREKITQLAKKIKGVMPTAVELAEMFNKLSYPEFSRETEFVALSAPDEYPYYEGDVKSSEGYDLPAKKFVGGLNEEQRPFRLVKSSKHEGREYLVNALARIHLNHEFLSPKAQELLDKSVIKFPDFNTFHNVVAQAIEVVHCLEEFQRLARQYSQTKGTTPFVQAKVKSGRGVGAGEAPRGTLYHEYEIDDKGIVTRCNIITPTAQFLFNIQQDLEVYLPQIKDKKLAQQKKEIRKMIRAYDPCISCATH